MGDPNEPSMWLIMGLGLTLMGGFIFLLWAVNRLAGRPKSEETPEEETCAPKRPHSQATPPMSSRLAALVMSYVFGSAGPVETIEREQRSYAVERSAEPSGTQAAEPVPSLVEQLAALDDDTLLDILALLPGEEDEYRFAESRIAKFIPGRVEDRLTQVRDIRGTQKPPAPGRILRVRDKAGERLISIR